MSHFSLFPFSSHQITWSTILPDINNIDNLKAFFSPDVQHLLLEKSTHMKEKLTKWHKIAPIIMDLSNNVAQ